METWAIVTLVLGASAISALLTFFITKMQVSHSDKRLTKQLESAREADYRQRRREVRSEPLLKLKVQLAIMAAKQERMVDATRSWYGPIGTAQKEETKKELQEAVDDWRDYGRKGDFLQTLFLQYDPELRELVERIASKYLLLREYALDYKNLRPEQLKEFRELSQEIKNRIPEVQELINKRLEEL